MAKNSKLNFEAYLPWMVLGVLLVYTLGGLFIKPFLGFQYSTASGRVVDIFIVREKGLHVGDELISIDGLSWKNYASDLLPSFPWQNYPAGETVSILVDRDGELTQVDWTISGFSRQELVSRLVNVWITGYFFWLAGTATVILIRPRDTRSRLLAAFCYVTAIWLVAGSFARGNFLGGPFVMRIALWLSLPIYLHLHWRIPRALRPLPKYAWPVFYLVAGIFALLQILTLLPDNSYIWPFAAAVIGSILLLAFRFFFRGEERREIGLLFLAAAVSFLPALLAAAFAATSTPALLLPGFLFGLVALPGAYFYVLYRRNLGGLEFRANRVVSLYLYLVLLLSALFVCLPLLSAWIESTQGTTAILFLAVVFTTALTVFGFRPFQSFVERRILRMPLPPENLLESYAAKISTSISQEHLTRVLRDEVLPSMLIRQSALLQVRENPGYAVLFAQGVELADLPEARQTIQLQELRNEDGVLRSPPQEGEWWQLVFPLEVNGEPVGLWLLGHKDPDGYYSGEEIKTLAALADQTAVAMVNIAQATRLRALHQADIDRQEEERTSLARELHDEVLHRLAEVGNSLEDSAYTPEFERRVHELSDHIRRTIHGLRPPMLSYGLHAALRELVDDLGKRAGVGLAIELAVPLDDVRYSPKIEQHAFRIIQQSCENALRHAAPRHIVIEGKLSETSIDLRVKDDGRGFEMEPEFDFSQLLAKRHFGLASMFERAALISADLEIHSEVGNGTEVQLVWEAV